MTTATSVSQANRALADLINQEARDNPLSPYAGKFVGITNGQVVVTADNLEEAIRLLLAVEPDRQKTFCFEAGIDYSEVQFVWETR
jgi:hypothetical protein